MPEFTNPSQIATRCVVSSGSPTSKSPTSEVRLSESISHQKVPPQLLCFICTYIALFGLWRSWDICYKGLVGIYVAEFDEIKKWKTPETTYKTRKYFCRVERSCCDVC